MKKLIAFNVLLINFIISVNSFAQFLPAKGDTNFYEVMNRTYVNGVIPTSDTGESDKEAVKFEEFWNKRLFPHGDFRIAADAYTNFAQNNLSKSTNSGVSAMWTEVGPVTEVRANYMGRLQAIAFDPDDSQTIFVGSPFGGVL